MLYEYNFYTTDESFDYGDLSWGGTCHETGYHGFEIEIDNQDVVDFSTFKAYGDYSEMENECKNIEQLRVYIKSHLDEIDEETGTSIEVFEELIEFINDQLSVKAVA